MDSEASPAGLALPGVSGKQGKVKELEQDQLFWRDVQVAWSLGSRLGL